MRRSFAALCAAFLVVLASLGTAGQAATPPSGSISPQSPAVGWTGPVETSNATGGCLPKRPGAYCDEFFLTVDSPSAAVKVDISWASSSDHFELYIYDKDNGQVASDGFNAATDLGKINATAVVRDASAARSPYKVQVKYSVVTASSYAGKAELALGDDPQQAAFFDTTDPLEFGPASLVSAHFLGAEPQMTMERRVPGALDGVTNPDRIFVDHPLSSRAQIGQLHRSLDGGDSFRLLFDPTCAQRSRPTCNTGGGGDSDNDVNLYNGNLFFADQQGTIAQEAVASSTDHGDSFPETRQWAVSNTTTLSDRQWLTAADNGSVSVLGRKIHAYLSYARFSTGIFVQGIDSDGLPIPQEVAQIGTAVGVPGRIEVDSNPASPGHNWIYVAYRANPLVTESLPRGIHVATAPAQNYRDRSAWISTKLTNNFPEIFVWLAIDEAGNAYATWVDKDRVLYSYSAIGDRLNDPRVGGRPGAKWSTPVQVSLPSLGSTIFPTITAGDAGRVAIGYYGTDDFFGLSGEAGPETEWHGYVAVIEDATAENGSPIVHTGKVSERIVHDGPILGDADGSDRSLLDFIDIDHDQDGRVGLVFTDNYSSFGRRQDPEGSRVKPFTYFAKQTGGPSLSSTVPDVTVAVPQDRRPDASGDSTWPNTEGVVTAVDRPAGRYLPSLDVLEASVSLSGEQLEARIPLRGTLAEDVARDLISFNRATPTAQPADRLKYVLRFSTDEEIFHLSAERKSDGATTFYGGRLDANDAVQHGGTTVMASYRSDPFYPVTGTLEGNVLVLRAPAAAFGVGDGTRLFGVSAFAMAGPDQSNETLFTPMRTVDASPPFDATLRPKVEPTPDESSTGGATPTPGNSPTPENIATPENSPTPGNTPTPGLSPSPTPDPSPTPVGRCDIVGTPGNDYLPGTDGDETICGRGGDDVLVGGGGKDTLLGGKGHDRLFGDAGSDRLNGQRGSDELRGGSGKDILLGRPHADELYGEAGNDSLRGGRGQDRCRGGYGRNRLMGCEQP